MPLLLLLVLLAAIDVAAARAFSQYLRHFAIFLHFLALRTYG